jgi:hypothetical protein
MIPKLWTLIDYTLNTLYNKNVPVIWSYQNAARIQKPYILLNYMTNDLPDHEYYEQFVDGNGYRRIGSWRKAVVDMQFFDAHDSIPLASFTAMALATEASLDKQVQLDCSIGNRLFLQRVPMLLNNSQYEDRAIYQFDFLYTETLGEDVGFIATVIIDGSYSGGYGDVLDPPMPPLCHEVITIPYPPDVVNPQTPARRD